MRMKPRAVAITGLFFLHCTVVAEDKPPAVKEMVQDEEWGYSYTCKGLEESPILRSFNVEALTAEFQAGDKDNLLKLDRSMSADSTRAGMEKLAKMMTSMGFTSGQVEESTLSGGKAYRLKVSQSGPDPLSGVYLFGDAEAGQPRWQFTCVCSGEKSADQLKLAEAAIKTFAFFREGEAPQARAGLQVSTRLRFSIETAGFEGEIKVFPFAILGGREFIAGKGKDRQLAGHLAVRLENTTSHDRTAAMEAIRKLNTTDTSKVVDFKELEVSGRKAARCWVEKTVSGSTTWEQDLYIWDSDLVWDIVISYGNVETAVAKAALEAALDSFKLLKEPRK